MDSRHDPIAYESAKAICDEFWVEFDMMLDPTRAGTAAALLVLETLAVDVAARAAALRKALNEGAVVP